MLLRSLGSLTSSFVDLLCPPLCLHCGEGLNTEESFLCSFCFDQLELIDPSFVCPRCFSKRYNTSSRQCSSCAKRPVLYTKCCSSFEDYGPASTLRNKMKNNNMPFLAKGCAAYMVMQLLRLDCPLPDVVIPIPVTLGSQFKRGFNHSALLAEEIGKILSRPTCNALKRKRKNYSGQDQEISSIESFVLKKGVDIVEKRVLVIDDFTRTGRTLHSAGEALCDGYPSSLYAMTFCRMG